MATALIGSKFVEEVQAKLKYKSDKVYIVNQGFRIYSKFTVALLVVCCGLVTLQQIKGKPIECVLPHKDDIRPEPLAQYCFIMSTYTLPHLYNATVGEQVAHFGVGTYDKDSDQEKIYHAYYQWVPFVLFFQAMFFYMPYMIWKAWEDDRIKTFCNLTIVDEVKMKHRKLIDESGDEGAKRKEKKEAEIGKAAVAFVAYLGYNNSYALMYVFCELLNFAVVIINIYATDSFLGNEFSTYGTEVLSFLSEDPENRIDPMSRVFPKVTKCDFHKYGPSGNLINYDVMCILTMNIVNEKVYTFLWFWFVILAVIGGLSLLYRLAVAFVPTLRNMIFERQLMRDGKDQFRCFSNRLGYPDYFVLKRIAGNVNGMRLGEFCESINKLIRENSPPMTPNTPPPDYVKSKDIDEDTKEPLVFSSSNNIYN